MSEVLPVEKPTGPVIEALGLTKFYGQVLGLNGIDLRIGSGITGLLGPKGAG